MKGQIGMWGTVMGLLILILASPFIYGVIAGVSGSVSDTASVAIMFAMPAILFFMFVFIILFFRGGNNEGY